MKNMKIFLKCLVANHHSRLKLTLCVLTHYLLLTYTFILLSCESSSESTRYTNKRIRINMTEEEMIKLEKMVEIKNGYESK
jgi:hypothetical protein